MNILKKPELKWLFLIGTLLFVVLGSYLRVSVLQNSVIDRPIRADAYDYYNYASNLKNFGIYSRLAADDEAPAPDALRSPGFPIFASAFYDAKPEVFVDNVIVAQTIFQVASFLLLTFALFLRCGPGVALLFSALLWTFPHWVNINIYFLSESLFTSALALVFAMALFFDYSKGEKNTLWPLFFGLVFGLAILIRPTLQYFPIFLFLILWFYQKKITRAATLMLLASFVPVLAWGMRNVLVTGAWSDPTLMINGLYHGSFPMFMYNGDPSTFGFPYHFDPKSLEVYEGVGKTIQIIFDRASSEPSKYISWYFAGKQFFLWQWSIIAGQGEIFIYPVVASPYYGEFVAVLTHKINYSIHLFWLLFAFLGLAYQLRKVIKRQPMSGLALMAVSVFLYAILIHVIVAPFPRYGIPFKIAAALVCVLSLQELLCWIRKRLP